ncbi:fungal-specific transcription factor domain-domain-containing protein [Microdochium bolleyi]|uniref:Fungal-specific transcription factor domain-domain-containing protein n=1 Tax=Microdochium bolleyi TaxID=196109 RepID=A0A136J142_9PEZI|nr:fungal-specific transcription factor domain-domain-containing protein [Microdochium bolleyi]
MQPGQSGFRRSQGCWTCKSRKIGCDKSVPVCNNCRRSGRICLGYGIRLTWPDQHDGRRKPARHVVTFLDSSAVSDGNVDSYATHFLNLTYTDFHTFNRSNHALLNFGSFDSDSAPRRPLSVLPDIHEQESHLLHYYTDRLTAMISTIDINNGFRDVLLPMALATPHAAASCGLRNAVFALAAFHLWGSRKALPYRVRAIRALSSSMTEQCHGTSEAQMAASMMLCVYNVFDETERDWAVHLQGAAHMLQQLAPDQASQSSRHFLCAWLLYHEVLGAFSQPCNQSPPYPFALGFLRALGVDQALIVGSLGCSIEIMEAIAYVNRLRSLQLSGELSQLAPEVYNMRLQEWDRVSERVSRLSQNLDSHTKSSLPPARRAQVLAIAELYRLAVLIYLVKVSPHHLFRASTNLPSISAYLDHAFVILDSLDTCTSPWPLFIIACECDIGEGTGDVQDQRRIAVLRALDGMDERRGIGNVFVLRRIIESFWKQKDLRAGAATASTTAADLRWWDVVELSGASPWFV